MADANEGDRDNNEAMGLSLSKDTTAAAAADANTAEAESAPTSDASAPDETAPATESVEEASAAVNGDANSVVEVENGNSDVAEAPIEKEQQAPEENGAPATIENASPVKITSPAKGDGAAAGEWAAQVRRILAQFQAENQEDVSKLKLPTCKVCQEPASLTCVLSACKWNQVPQCAACFDKSHPETDNGNDRHPRVSSTICPQCRLDRVTFWCIECDLTFCVECFNAIHSVKRTTKHRRLCVEGTPGSLFVRASWSPHFLTDVLDIAKRHNPLEVNPDELMPEADRTQPVSLSSNAAADNPSLSNSAAADEALMKEITPNGVANINGPTQPREVISIDSDDDPDIAAVVEAQLSSNAVNATSFPSPPQSLLSAVDSFLIPPTTTQQPSQFYQQTQRHTGMAFGQSTQVPQQPSLFNGVSSSHSYSAPASTMSTPVAAASSVPAGNSGSQPSWSNSTSSRDLSTNFANPALLASLSMIPNPLAEHFYEQYHKINTVVMNLENSIVQLNQRIIIASQSNIQEAQAGAAQLQKVHERLEKARRNRDIAVTQLVVQSPSLIDRVKRLRMDTLTDIPQLQISFHQKCYALTMNINQTKNNILTLNQQMNSQVEVRYSMNAQLFHAEIMRINQTLQVQEKYLQQCQREREDEIVNLVQYTSKIREGLKQTIHQQHLRRQQAAQQQASRLQPVSQAQSVPQQMQQAYSHTANPPIFQHQQQNHQPTQQSVAFQMNHQGMHPPR